MDCKDLARKAEIARAALIDLAAAGAKVPKLRLNLVRSIELLEELAIRARADGANRETFTGGEMLSKAMPGGLTIPAGVLPALNAPLTPEALIAHEIKVRKELAARIGAKGGRMRTPAQAATLAKAVAVRAKNIAARKAAKLAAEAAPKMATS